MPNNVCVISKPVYCLLKEEEEKEGDENREGGKEGREGGRTGTLLCFTVLHVED